MARSEQPTEQDLIETLIDAARDRSAFIRPQFSIHVTDRKLWGALDALDAYRSGDTPEPCTETALRLGCTCTIPFASSADIDPPEPKVDGDCPLHGFNPDPDAAREAAREDRP